MLRICTRSLLSQQSGVQYLGGIQRISTIRVGGNLQKPFKREILPSPVIRSFSQNAYLRQQQENSSSSSTITTEEPKLSLTFTCTANGCNHRSTHQFTKRSYERGIVLVQCPSCKNRHLIADHLGWFTETKDDPKTVEQIVAAHGGRVRKGIQYEDGKGYETMEIFSDSDVSSKNQS